MRMHGAALSIFVAGLTTKYASMSLGWVGAFLATFWHLFCKFVAGCPMRLLCGLFWRLECLHCTENICCRFHSGPVAAWPLLGQAPQFWIGAFWIGVLA
jgi:hypothetical protein